MANFAALIDVLTIAGSRLSTGVANASGNVWFFEPGGNTPVVVYSDAETSAVVTQPVVLTSGGLVNRSDYPDGLYVTQPVRVYIEDVDGNTVVDTVYVPATAGDVGVDNDGFTDSNLDDVLTKAHVSFGGQDWQYLIAAGQTARPYNEVITEQSISVKAFGAVGDGIAIDTTAIQTALNFAKAEGGGVVYFPPGTYKVDQTLTLTSANGISIVGAGASAISQTNATANGFTITSCDNLRIANINVTHATSSSGTAYSLTSCDAVTMTNANAGSVAVGGDYLVALFADTCTELYIFGCTFASTGASNKGVVLDDVSRFGMFGGSVGSSLGTTLELTGGTDFGSFHGVFLSTVSFPAGYTGIGLIDFFGCSGVAVTVATATIPGFRVFGGDPQASATSSATTAAQTPSLISGREVILTAASGGAGVVTVNAPAVLPGTDANVDVNQYWDFVFKNAAGGAVTWTTAAVYVLVGGVAVPGVDGTTVSVRFRWDRTTSELRECYRAVTTT